MIFCADGGWVMAALEFAEFIDWLAWPVHLPARRACLTICSENRR